MSNYQMQMPAQYTSIGDDEMVLLCGGETTAWQTFQDIGRVLNYVARIFSAGSSIVNNVVTIVNYFNKLEDKEALHCRTGPLYCLMKGKLFQPQGLTCFAFRIW